MRPESRFTAMVASHLLLVNHLLFGLTYNSPMSPLHPNTLDGAYEDKPHKMRHKKPSLVSYSLAGNDDTETDSISLGGGCSHGCLHCSAVNGCLSCRSSFFLTLRRDGPRQLAFCERSCPKGYYKKRYNGKGYCASCQVHGCLECQSAVHCSRCATGYTRDLEQGLCHRIGDITTTPGTSMPESDPHLPSIVDPPVLLTEEPVKRSSVNTPRQNKKIRRSKTRKLKRRKHGGRPLPRRRGQHRRRGPRGDRMRTNRRNQLRRRVNFNGVDSITETAGLRRRVGKVSRPSNRTRGSIGRRISRRRRLKKKYRKRMKKILQMLSKKRLRGDTQENSKLPDRSKHLPLRQYQPEVTLMRPSRHALKAEDNATNASTLAGQTISKNVNSGRKFSDSSIVVDVEHPNELPIPDRSEREVDSSLMNINALPNNLTRTAIFPNAKSRNLITYKRPRQRFHRRRRRFKERNEKISEVSN